MRWLKAFGLVAVALIGVLAVVVLLNWRSVEQGRAADEARIITSVQRDLIVTLRGMQRHTLTLIRGVAALPVGTLSGDLRDFLNDADAQHAAYFDALDALRLRYGDDSSVVSGSTRTDVTHTVQTSLMWGAFGWDLTFDPFLDGIPPLLHLLAGVDPDAPDERALLLALARHVDESRAYLDDMGPSISDGDLRAVTDALRGTLDGEHDWLLARLGDAYDPDVVPPPFPAGDGVALSARCLNMYNTDYGNLPSGYAAPFDAQLMALPPLADARAAMDALIAWLPQQMATAPVAGYLRGLVSVNAFLVNWQTYTPSNGGGYFPVMPAAHDDLDYFSSAEIDVTFTNLRVYPDRTLALADMVLTTHQTTTTQTASGTQSSTYTRTTTYPPYPLMLARADMTVTLTVTWWMERYFLLPGYVPPPIQDTRQFTIPDVTAALDYCAE